MYRIEAIQPGVVDAVRRWGKLQVNGYEFQVLEGRVISEPVPEEHIGSFDVPGYFLVREEPPYERVAPLGQGQKWKEIDQALREGRANLEDLQGVNLSELPKAELLKLARQRGLVVSERTTKQELLVLLQGGGGGSEP